MKRFFSVLAVLLVVAIAAVAADTTIRGPITFGPGFIVVGSRVTGTVVSKVINTTYDLATVSGNQPVTGFGFKPSTCLAFGAVGGAIFGITYAGHSGNSLNQARLNASSGVAGQVSQGSQFMVAAIDNSNLQVGTLVSYDTDGITISWVKTGSPTGTFAESFLCFE